MSLTTVEGAIVQMLLSDYETTSFVGNRIHPATDPQNVARPKLTYQKIRGTSNTENGGFSNTGATGLQVSTFQIDCWSDSMLTAKQTISAVRKCLIGFAGTIDEIRIDCIRKTDERELPADLYTGQTKPVQRYMIEINVSHADC
jgi:hypothetical protein